MDERAFTLPQLAKAAEIEYRTLHNWLRRGLVRASRRSATGSGRANLFAIADALEARILADLRRAGLDLAALERAAKALQSEPQRLEGDEVLLINGRLDVITSDHQIRKALDENQPALFYRVTGARRALEARL